MSRPRRVLVTGLGVATSLGLEVEELWARALAGESGIRALEDPLRQRSPIRAAGALPDADWNRIADAFPETAADPGGRRELLALWATRAALADAGLDGAAPGCGVALATGVGEIRLEDARLGRDGNGRFDGDLFVARAQRVDPRSSLRRPADRAAALVARRFRLTGPNLTVSSACASAAQAIGLALRLVRRGDAEVMVAGGADSMLDPVGSVMFPLLGASAPTTGPADSLCRPFDRRRRGLVLGEGAGIVVLEAEDHARARGRIGHAELAGYGASMDRHLPTAPHPEGRGAARAMTAALADAGLEPSQVGYVNAHGTGTPLNDVAETLAIRRVLGEHADRVPVSSTKSLLGHLVAACGGPELVVTVLSVARGAVHPTRSLTTPDPRCALDHVVDVARRVRLRAALSSSFGFGGQNACLAVRALQERS